jgi:hypothetical protein
MSNPRYYEDLGYCDICGKTVRSSKAHSSWTDDDGEYHVVHSDCEPSIDYAPLP